MPKFPRYNIKPRFSKDNPTVPNELFPRDTFEVNLGDVMRALTKAEDMRKAADAMGDRDEVMYWMGVEHTLRAWSTRM